MTGDEPRLIASSSLSSLSVLDSPLYWLGNEGATRGEVPGLLGSAAGPSACEVSGREEEDGDFSSDFSDACRKKLSSFASLWKS